MRRLVPAIAIIPLLALGVAAAPPAVAAVEIVKDPTAKFTVPYVSASTDAVVKVKLTQTSYANISLNVAFAGFHAHNAVSYGKGTCPTWVARIITPSQVTVQKCGWDQEGNDAVLRLSLEGPLSNESVKIRVKSESLTAPAVAGVYGVFLSSWAFDEATIPTEIFTGPVK